MIKSYTMNCGICNKSFGNQGALTRHIKKDHPEQSANYSKADKATVFIREYGDNAAKGKCTVCKIQEFHVSSSAWHMGHIISVRNGGTKTLNNLKPICASCNYAMGEKNWYDYLVEKGLEIPDDVRRQNSAYEFKDARASFEKSYNKICKRLDFKNVKYTEATKYVLTCLSDLSCLAGEADFHHLFLKKIFNYDAIKENYSRASLDNYLDTMYTRDDKESFRNISHAVQMIAEKTPLNEHVDEVVKMTQICYLIYLCIIKGNDRKRKKVLMDIQAEFNLRITNSKEAMSLALYTIDIEGDLTNEAHQSYKKRYDLFRTYV